MTWGTGSWGDSPWGGGAPSVGGVVSIDSVRFITPQLIRLHLSTGVVVNATYKDASNYTIQVHSDTPVTSDPVNVLRVLVPANDVLAVDYVYLETTQHTLGGNYKVSFTSLSTLDGVAGASAGFTAYNSRTTKTMLALKSLPKHFDRRPDSLIFNVIAAISLQDDDVGGSRNDEFP